MRPYIVLWLMALLFFLGCSYLYQADWLASPEEGTLTGHVILEAGRGFDDVDVTLTRLGEGDEVEEDWDVDLSARGEFRVEDLTPGNYRLDIIKARYDPYFYYFSLGDQERIYLEVELKRYSIPDAIWDVRVVGDFLDWDPQKAVPMEDADGDGYWEVSIPFPSGRYSYNYIINGLEDWFIDIDSRLYEPDGHGYYHSVLNLDQAALVDFHLNPEDSWYRRASFGESVSEQEVGWVIWEPEEPRQGQEISILYDARGGPLEGTQQIYLHWGINGWTVPAEPPEDAIEYGDGHSIQSPMRLLSEDVWWIVIPTDQEVETVDFVFTDGQRWDNNGNQDWHIPVLIFEQIEMPPEMNE